MPVKKMVERIDFDTETGIPFVEDIRGDFHIIDWVSTANISESPRIYLQSELKNYLWGTSSAYNRIPDSMNPGNFLVYTVPENSKLHLAFFIATAVQRGADTGMTSVGLYVNGIMRTVVPFFREIQYKMFSPIIFTAGTEIEFKVKPGTKNTDFGIITGGYLIKSS